MQPQKSTRAWGVIDAGTDRISARVRAMPTAKSRKREAAQGISEVERRIESQLVASNSRWRDPSGPRSHVPSECFPAWRARALIRSVSASIDRYVDI
jgi:hypothetical protein